MYIDFHSHILPRIDDGSKSPSQSIDMLKNARDQGISTVICTPHFYPLSMNIKNFLINREHALNRFNEALEGSELKITSPSILFGAECMYIKRISRYPGLEKLCIEGTSYLLFELPYTDWDDDIFEEIYLLTVKRGISCIIAHPDRFYDQIKKLNAVSKFSELDCLLQINAGPITHFSKKKINLTLLSCSVPCVLGSDMHSDDADEQKIPQAMNIIERKYGLPAKQKILDVSAAVLKNEPPCRIKELWQESYNL